MRQVYHRPHLDEKRRALDGPDNVRNLTAAAGKAVDMQARGRWFPNPPEAILRVWRPRHAGRALVAAQSVEVAK